MARQAEQFYQNFLDEIGGNLKIKVPPCNRPAKEISNLRIEERGVLFVPDGLTVGHLDKMFPQMLSREFPRVRKSVMENWDEPVSGGWYDVEQQSESPNRGAAKSDASIVFSSKGREEQSLPVYILASQVNKKVTGHFFDEESWTRLSNSWQNGDGLGVGFSAGGQLRVTRLDPEQPHPNIGFRSQGKKV
jgi:hypothetical protein